MDVASVPSSSADERHGEELAEITNGIVQLFSEYYGRGPTRAKSYLLDNTFVVTALRDTMTTVERTLVENGHSDEVRSVRLKFQEAMAPSFTGVVEKALGRRVGGYHSQLLVDADIGFELFVLDED
jgi:uncharacterized protein YbcI